MDKIETLTTELNQTKQSLLQELQNYIYPDTNTPNIAKCIKSLHQISISLLKINLFKDTHEDLQLHNIDEYKEKSLEEILYSAIEEPFPKTLKIMTTLKYLLPQYYKDMLLRALESNDFKEITYLLPPGNLQSNPKGNSQSILRQELWSTLNNAAMLNDDSNSFLYIEDIVEYLSAIGERENSQSVLQILQEDKSIEILEKKDWENFIQEMTDLNKAKFLIDLAESLYNESGDIKTSLKVLEDAFFRGYSLEVLRDKLIFYSISCLMIYKIGIITINLKDLETLKGATLIDHLFETVLQYKPKQLLLLKQNLKSVYSLYSTEEILNQLFEEFLLSQTVRTFGIFLTLDQKSPDNIKQLLIEDENKLYDLVYKYIHQNCFFEHYEFINKMVKLLKSTLTLETRLRYIEDIEKLEFDAECVELMFNFNVNQKFSSLEEFEEMDKLAQSRERGLDILSQIVTNYNRNYIRFAHVTLKGKPIDLKSARAVLNVLLHLQEHVMKKCINVSLVYQVFVKKLLEFGNTRDVQQLIDRENLLETINKEIFEMIVVEVVSKMLDKLPNLSMLDDDLTIKIKRCFDLIPWSSEVKDAERALYKVCLQLKDSEELYSLNPSEIRSCNKIDLLKRIVKSSSKAFEKTSYVDLYTLLRQIEFKSIDGDKEFIAFMADFIDSYLQNNDKRKVDDLIDYLNENDYEKISEVLIKILKEKSIAVKSKDKEYYMKLGVLNCRDPNLLVEYFKDDSVPFLKDLNKDIYTDSPASMKILLADFDLLTPEVYRKRQEFDTTWNMKAFFIDIYKKTTVNRQWNDALFFFLSNLTVNHQRAFAFLAQAPGITISTFDTILEMLVKSSYFNIEKTCTFFLNYVLPDNLKYNIYAKEQPSNWYKQYGNSSDFQRVITKYQDLQALGKDFASFQSLVDWKDQVKFVYDQEFRKDVISKMIVVAHSDPEIVEKAHKYGLEAGFIHLRMLESTFYGISETNVTESLQTIKETLDQISLESTEQKNFIKILRDDIYEKSPSIKYLPELFSLISEKIPNCFNQANLKLLQALISVNLQDKLKPFISFNMFLSPEFQNSSFDKILDFGKLKETIKKEIDQSNVFILSKSIPVLIPNSLTPEDIQFTMLLNQICENNILWQKMNLIRISEGRVSENNEAKLYVDRIDMLLNQMNPKLLLAVLKELIYINMDISGVSHKEDSNLLQFLRLSLHYQQFFIEKIIKKLTEKGYLIHPQEEEIGLSQVVKVKLRLLNQLEGLYQNDLPKVLPLRDFMGIKSPNRLSNFIFGLFNHEVISSPMLVGLIKELGKDAFIKGYLKNELSAKLEETSIEISDRLWDVWDQAITFKKILSTNRLEKNNFVVNLEKIENDNSQEFEPLIRFLQKTNELFILDEEFAQETRDSLAQVIINTVIENPNYQFRLKLMLLYISFKYMSEISAPTQQRNKNVVFEIFALLDKGFNEYESMFQFGKFLLDVLLSDSPGIFLVQLFDNLVFAPKEKLFYQNLILRDVAFRLPSDDLIRHCLDNLINFNCHESSDMIFDLFFVRRTKAITVDRETSTKNILNLILEEMSYKVDRKTKFKIEENIQNLIKPILPGSKGAQLIYKYLIYKARTSILQKTDHYEPCLEFAKDMFRAFSNKQEISEDFDIEEVLDYNEDIHQICIYELWAGKTLEYIVLKNVIDLIECGSDLEAARIVTEYMKEVKLEEGPGADDKAFKNLKSFLEGIMRDEKGVYKKIQPLVKATLDKIT